MRKSVLTAASLLLAAAAFAADDGSAVAVIFNTAVPESRDVAMHYARARHVPAGQVIGLDAPDKEVIDRFEYRDKIQDPLLAQLQERGLLEFTGGFNAKWTNGASRVSPTTIRYLVLCYGIPLHINNDPRYTEPQDAATPEPFRNNGAAVDAELTLLPSIGRYPFIGAVNNPFYGATNPDRIQATNGLFLVARLDGSTPAIASALVDKALDAETNGLWGRAYFDMEGLTNGAYKQGDDWIRAASGFTRNAGFDVVVDTRPEPFSAGFPMSQVALFAGWQEPGLFGVEPKAHFEFMPGAFAYMLYSYSAKSLRTANKWCCAPLLAMGATATMGCVDEPYLEFTPNMAIFFYSFVTRGMNFGEASLVCQRALSWQTTVIGDPLYRPFGKVPRAQHEQLLAEHNPLVQWSYLRIINMSLLLGTPVKSAIDTLKKNDLTPHSAVLSEKLADLYEQTGDIDNSIRAAKRALESDPTPQQRVRLMLSLAAKYRSLGDVRRSLEADEQFLKTTPDYPDAVALYRAMEDEAQHAGLNAQARGYDRKIWDLTNARPAP